MVLSVAFAVCCVRSYSKGLVVYRDAHDFDRQLAAAFAVGGDAELAKIYPNPVIALKICNTLESPAAARAAWPQSGSSSHSIERRAHIAQDRKSVV